MIPRLAAKKLVRSESVTTAAWEVKSDAVRAIDVTLRLIEIADENSTVPKNSTSMIGTTMANSVAATPRRSFSRRATRRHARTHVFRADPIVRLMIRRLRYKARFGTRQLPPEAAGCRSNLRC